MSTLPLPRPRHGAFTLLEVLVVVAIIALLSAIMLPVLATARGMARRTSCTSQLRQIGLALHMYRQDADELPPYLSATYPAYLNSAQLLVCPNDADRGIRPGNLYLEGDLMLPSGVSYQYYPCWTEAVTLGWYQPAPRFGNGKWDDLTPVVGCAWHWARSFSSTATGNSAGSRGWQLMLTLGGSVRKMRVETPLEEFTPSHYN